MSARLLPILTNDEEVEKTFIKYNKEICESVKRLKEMYNNKYQVAILLNNKGFMTMIAEYFYGEKFITGYSSTGKAYYSDKLSKNRLKLINEKYALYKII